MSDGDLLTVLQLGESAAERLGAHVRKAFDTGDGTEGIA